MDGSSPRSSLLRSVGWAVVHSLVAVGSLYMAVPEAWAALAEHRRRRAAGRDGARPLAGPPAGHPERLSPEVPLSPLERWLSEELLRQPPKRPGR
ncbi:DUF6059 family protein [Streptomyces sp. bgisy159]|uniref:DUF6059 family protein n=1 Tax=Streptomyces sp. bgisy159 TaxID=3413795 RepID=UPI003F49F30A